LKHLEEVRIGWNPESCWIVPLEENGAQA